MKRYMLFVHEPNTPGPCVGAVEVPPCFVPTEELIEAAWESNIGILVVSEKELEARGGLVGLFLAQGDCLLKVLKRLVEEPDADLSEFTIPGFPSRPNPSHN